MANEGSSIEKFATISVRRRFAELLKTVGAFAEQHRQTIRGMATLNASLNEHLNALRAISSYRGEMISLGDPPIEGLRKVEEAVLLGARTRAEMNNKVKKSATALRELFEDTEFLSAFRAAIEQKNCAVQNRLASQSTSLQEPAPIPATASAIEAFQRYFECHYYPDVEQNIQSITACATEWLRWQRVVNPNIDNMICRFGSLAELYTHPGSFGASEKPFPNIDLIDQNLQTLLSIPGIDCQLSENIKKLHETIASPDFIDLMKSANAEIRLLSMINTQKLCEQSAPTFGKPKNNERPSQRQPGGQRER